MAEEQPKKRSKRKLLLWILGGIIALVAVVAIVGVLVVRSFLSEDFIVELIEEKNNCRVQIGRFSVRGWSPAQVRLEQVWLAPRDAVADAGTPHSKRERLEGGAVVVLGSVLLEASLGDLLKKELNVRSLAIDGLHMNFLILQEGGTSLDELFDPPVTVAGNPNQEYEERKARRERNRERKKLTEEEREKTDPETFRAADLPMPASMNELKITNSAVFAKMKKNKTRIELSDIQISLKDINVNPADLASNNTAQLQMSATLAVKNREHVPYATMDIVGSGDIVPFDKTTGLWNPDLAYDITVKKGAEISRLPPLIKLGEKLESWRKYGIELESLGEHIVFEEDATVRTSYFDNQLRIMSTTGIRFSGHHLVVEGGSWLNTGTNQHELLGEIFLAEDYSADAREEAISSLMDETGLKRDIAESIASILLSPITKEKQLWLPFETSGDFEDAKALPRVKLGDTKELLMKEAGNRAEELLKGLLGR